MGNLDWQISKRNFTNFILEQLLELFLFCTIYCESQILLFLMLSILLFSSSINISHDFYASLCNHLLSTAPLGDIDKTNANKTVCTFPITIMEMLIASQPYTHLTYIYYPFFCCFFIWCFRFFYMMLSFCWQTFSITMFFLVQLRFYCNFIFLSVKEFMLS